MVAKGRKGFSGGHDRLATLFEPDVLLPAQFFAAFRRAGGLERGDRVWYLDGEGVGASLGIREAQTPGVHDRYALGLHHLAFEA